METRNWPVRRYSRWDYGKTTWQHVNVDPQVGLHLSVKGTQVLLSDKQSVLEFFSLAQEPTVWFKNLIMAIVIRAGERFRKFKILLTTRKDAMEALQFFQKFVTCKQWTGNAYSVLNCKGLPENSPSREQSEEVAETSTYRPQESTGTAGCSGETLPEILIGRIMSKNRPSPPAPDPLPDGYPLESFVRLCIMDPGFPALVDQVEKILEKYQA